MNIKGQGHSYSTFSNVFSLETAWSIEAKVHMMPPSDDGMKYGRHAHIW